MLSKYEQAISFLQNNLTLFKCPFCEEKLFLKEHTLMCPYNHTLNISKKGTINFLTTNHYVDSPIYNDILFQNRREFISNGFYKTLYDKISSYVNAYFEGKYKISILDLGCGEGMHSLKILEKFNVDYTYCGFDYAKTAIKLASDYISKKRFFFVGDVGNIPLQDKSIELILDILSPYSEKEVTRILKNDGLFIKVCPGPKYLDELRINQGLPSYKKGEDIENNLNRQFKIIDQMSITETLPLTKLQYANLLNMTPISDKKITDFCSQITIDLIIYVMKLRNL